MAIVIDRETGAKIVIEADMVKFYREEVQAGVIDVPRRTSPFVEPGWGKSDKEIMRAQQPQDSIERALSAIEGASYELAVKGEVKKTGIITGFDQRAPTLAGARVLAIEDRGATDVGEVAYPLGLMLAGRRGDLSMRVHFSDLGGVFAKGKLIAAVKGQ